MPTELETQAAEAKCLCIENNQPVCIACGPTPDVSVVIHGPTCLNCGGTGLRWPTLSRKISMGDPQHSARYLIGSRIPDCTLEKVFGPGMVVSLWYDGKTFKEPTYVALAEDDPTNPFFGDTPLEAALAALLSSEPPAKPD